MTTPASPTYEELAQELADTRNLLASLQANQAAQGVATPKGPSKVKKFLASLVAAFSTPEAVKSEKYLAVVALTRAAVLIPGAAVLIDLAIQALGGPSVKP